MTTVIVAGVTGYIGRHFTERGGSRFYIVGVARRPEEGPVEGLDSMGTFDTLRDRCREWPPGSVLIHAVGCGRETFPGAMFECNVRRTEQLVEAAERAGVSLLVFVSGFGIGDGSTSAYYSTKREAERLVRASRVPSVIIRCSYIVGRGDELTPRIASEASRKGGEVRVPGDGSYRIQPVFIDDLIDVLVATVDSPPPRPDLINVLGEAVTFGRFTRDVARGVTAKAKTVTVPLEVFVRQAVAETEPDFGLDELGILVADRVGPVTRKCLGVEIRPYPRLVAAVVDALLDPGNVTFDE